MKSRYSSVIMKVIIAPFSERFQLCFLVYDSGMTQPINSSDCLTRTVTGKTCKYFIKNRKPVCTPWPYNLYLTFDHEQSVERHLAQLPAVLVEVVGCVDVRASVLGRAQLVGGDPVRVRQPHQRRQLELVLEPVEGVGVDGVGQVDVGRGP